MTTENIGKPLFSTSMGLSESDDEQMWVDADSVEEIEIEIPARGLVIDASTKSVRADLFDLFKDADELVIMDETGKPLYRIPIVRASK